MYTEQNHYICSLVIGERAKQARHSQDNTIENRGYLFVCIHVWMYVCHFLL